MMGLLSTIRGNKGQTQKGIGGAEVGPISAKSRKIVIQEWPRLLEHQHDLFKIVWLRSASRSTSIKKAFGLADNEMAEHNQAFLSLGVTIAAFFKKLIVNYQLDEDRVRSTCVQLGRRHVDFIERGFNSTFWDIFLVCMAEVIDETLSEYISDESKRAEVQLAWERVINAIVHHMRAGYNERRMEQKVQKNTDGTPTIQ